MNANSGQAGHRRPGTLITHLRRDPALPNVAVTLLVTLFFGLFDVIPAAVHSSRARRLGRLTPRYWKAFGWSLGI